MWKIFDIYFIIIQIYIIQNLAIPQTFNVKESTKNEHYTSGWNLPSAIDNPFQSSNNNNNYYNNNRFSNVKNQLQNDYIDHNGKTIGHFWWSCNGYNCGRGKK